MTPRPRRGGAAAPGGAPMLEPAREPDPPPAPSGGLGGESGRGIRDTRLVERALREHWPIPEESRGPLVRRLLGIVLDREASPREVTSAARAILAASKLNLESVAATMRAQEHEELIARVEELERVAEQGGRHR